MNASSATPSYPAIASKPVTPDRAVFRLREVGWISLLLVLVNGAAWLGLIGESWTFHGPSVAAGQWWRLVTHPWIHVSWYHFLLDGGAFLFLYHALQERSVAKRWMCVFASGSGSLLTSWWLDPGLAQTGLCGLSGIAHGLMAVSSVEMMAQHGWRSAEGRVGAISLALLAVKVCYEAMTGHMFLEFLHFGLMGNPVAVTHAGGVLGGLLWSGAMWFRRKAVS